MILKILLVVLCLRISNTYSAPLQLQLLQQYQRIMMQQQQQKIQQQLLELQALQQLNPMMAPVPLNNQPLMVFFLPQNQANMNIEEKQNSNDNINNKLKLRQHMTKTKDEDSDSVIIDAEPLPMIKSEPIPILEEQKAIFVLPNGRLFIGDLISAIPFLPIEINVPDAISWAYNGIANGISGIISIIGQRKPLADSTTGTVAGVATGEITDPVSAGTATKGIGFKTMFNDIQITKEKESHKRPFVLMPLEHFMSPIVPIQL